MKRTVVTIGWIVLMVVTGLNLIGCSPVREAKAIAPQPAASLTAQAPVSSAVEASGPSCANPTPELAAGCEAAAQHILATTVRLEFHGPAGGIGHATVVGGRYLITHNHYPVTAEQLQDGGDGAVSAVSVLKADGGIILLKAPLAYFTVAAEGSETLVLDFQAYGGVGFFDSLGVPSAKLGEGAASLPRPGSEVAQIDWDGATTHVAWVRVTAIQTEGDAPYVELDRFVEQGASGGGVFFDGAHIANNWTRQTDRLETGEIVRQYSVAALNSSQQTALFNQ